MSYISKFNQSVNKLVGTAPDASTLKSEATQLSKMNPNDPQATALLGKLLNQCAADGQGQSDINQLAFSILQEQTDNQLVKGVKMYQQLDPSSAKAQKLATVVENLNLQRHELLASPFNTSTSNTLNQQT